MRLGSLGSISAKSQVTKRCSRNWLKQRCKPGSPIYHCTRKLSKALGTKSRVTKATIDMLLSPLHNLVRNQTLEAQIEFYKILVKRRQLAKRFRQKDDGAQIYSIAYTKSDFSTNNVTRQLKYNQKYISDTVYNI